MLSGSASGTGCPVGESLSGVGEVGVPGEGVIAAGESFVRLEPAAA